MRGLPRVLYAEIVPHGIRHSMWAGSAACRFHQDVNGASASALSPVLPRLMPIQYMLWGPAVRYTGVPG